MSKLQPGVGCTFTRDGNSFSLNVETSPGRRRSPLEVYSNPISPSQTAVSVWPGTVNGVMPKIAGDYLDATNRPKLTISGNGHIYIKVTRNTGDVFPKTVDVEFGSTVPADTSTTGHFTIATVQKNNGSLTINQAVSSSLIVGRQAYGLTGAIFYWFNV